MISFLIEHAAYFLALTGYVVFCTFIPNATLSNLVLGIIFMSVFYWSKQLWRQL